MRHQSPLWLVTCVILSGCVGKHASQLPTFDVVGEAVEVLRNINGISRVIELSNGTLVFGELWEKRLGFIGPGARLVRYVGREGRGPGELSHIDGLVRLRGDSIAVIDAMNRRLSVFDSGGRFVRMIVLTAPPARSTWLDCSFFSDAAGRVYAVPADGLSDRLRDHLRPRDIDTLPIVRFSADGGPAKQLWSIEARAPQWYPMAKGELRSRMPLTAPVVVGVTGDATIVAMTWDGSRLIYRQDDGATAITPPLELPHRRVTKAQRDSVTRWYDSKATYQGAQLEFPQNRAAYDLGIIAPNGITWLRSTETPSERSAFLLVDTSGRRLANVLLPVTSRIVGFGINALFIVTEGKEGGSDLQVVSLGTMGSPPR